MRDCWHPDPEKRPQFKEIVKRIERAQKGRIFDERDRDEATTFGNKGSLLTENATVALILLALLIVPFFIYAVQIALSELEVGQQIGYGTLCKYE
jgi:hypothetical protein